MGFAVGAAVGAAVGLLEGVCTFPAVNVVTPVMTISSHCVTSAVVTLPALCEVLLYEVNTVGGFPVISSYTFALLLLVFDGSNPARFSVLRYFVALSMEEKRTNVRLECTVVVLFAFNVPVASTLTVVSLTHVVCHELMVTLRSVKLRSALTKFSSNAS